MRAATAPQMRDRNVKCPWAHTVRVHLQPQPRRPQQPQSRLAIRGGGLVGALHSSSVANLQRDWGNTAPEVWNQVQMEGSVEMGRNAAWAIGWLGPGCYKDGLFRLFRASM